MSEEKMQVLKMLEQGKITHEEALSLLKALNEGPDISVKQQPPSESKAEIAKAMSSISTEVRDGLNEGLAELRSSLQDAFGDVRSAMQEVSGELGEAMEEVRSELSEAMNEIPKNFSGVDWFTGLFGLAMPEHKFEDEETLEVAGNTENLDLTVDTKNGYIRLTPAEDDSIHLTVLKKIRAESKEKASEIAEQCVIKELTSEGTKLKLKLSVDQELQGAVSFLLAIPARLMVGLALFTKNGSVDLTDISGSGIIESKNGRLQVKGGKFDALRAVTKNGSVILATEAEDLIAETKNGAVRCSLQPGFSGRYFMESKNGSIQVVTIPSAASYRVDAATTHGVARVTLREFTPEQQSKHGVTGQSAGYEGAQVKVDLKLVTKNGSVTVQEAE